MKKILTGLAICLTIPSISNAMQPRLYDEAQFSMQENAGRDFTPVPKPAPGADATAYHQMRENYTQIANQTGNACRRGGYVTAKGTSVSDLGIGYSRKHSQKIDGRMIGNVTASNKQRLNIGVTIVNQDTYQAVIDIHKTSNGKAKVAVLNFANSTSAGGGYLHGSNAQEEDLCRRSTLYAALKMHKDRGEYPIAHNELIYTPKVKIIRDTNVNGFRFLDAPYTCDVITQAAYNLNSNHRGAGGFRAISDTEYQDGMLNKIRYQFRIAAAKGCGTIVVGAFGCGAFRNSPEVVADFYATVLQEAEFKNVFNEVRFAILGTTNNTAFSQGLAGL